MANKRQTQSSQNILGHQVDDPFQIYDLLKQHISSKSVLLLALSGGVDSIVLLHQLISMQSKLKFSLHAMHVHHGLSPHADDWADFCALTCKQYQVPLTVQRITLDKNSGLGIEGAARAARYAALQAYRLDRQSPDCIVTAHHQADQAETLLLQLCRGAGAKGLAAMPVFDQKQLLLRPFLHIDREQIETYAQQNALAWCEDESNANTDYDRNFMRHEVLPLLSAKYPALQKTLSRTATHMAETQTLLTDLALIDTDVCVNNKRLDLTALAALSTARIKNVFRWWLSSHNCPMPSAERLTEMMQQLMTAKSDASVYIKHERSALLRYDRFAYIESLEKVEAPSTYSFEWHGESSLDLPNGDQLHFKKVLGQGITMLHGLETLTICSRQGGEKLKLANNRPNKLLKQLFQEAKIPPWQRVATPMIYDGSVLVSVPLLGVAAAYQTPKDQIGLVISLIQKV